MATDGQPTIVCLLPARNAAADLPAFLDSVQPLCDAVVALDDGSTDGTPEILELSPLVKLLLTNPQREDYAGWNDSRNRNRLLQAAADLSPEWIVSLDADERLDLEDASALRNFLLTDALPGLAYGLLHFRMWEDERYVPAPKWIYRVFAFEPGQRFPRRPLHFDPVPTSIPRLRWIRTTIRVRHHGAASASAIAERLEKYRMADPNAVYRTDFGGLTDLPAGEVPRWEPRAPSLPVLLSDPKAPPMISPPTERPASLAVLLPARNAAPDLPFYLESISRLADAVIALDDGSTDSTHAILEAHPLVRRVLMNPRREDYRGWDDAANRNRLLGAAAELEPGWVLFLDADERIDPADAATLRRFLAEEAQPGFAYGFRVFRMTEDGRHYDRAGLWVYRLFAFEPGLKLPKRRLHLIPVPTGIPRKRWLRTTIRIQHFGGSTEKRRLDRVSKYRAADPTGEYQSEYLNLLAPPYVLMPWEERPPGLPVLVDTPTGAAASVEVPDLGPNAPAISAIVIAHDDEERIERTVQSVVMQKCPEPFEVIVVASGSDRTAAIVREHFPQVRLVELPRPALPGEARNAGLRLARGDYVSFPGSHVELPQGSLAARLRAHERGYPMVTGVILNGTSTPSGWASYFLDHSGNVPGVPSAELDGPPSHCSYDRDLLLSTGWFPEDMRAGEDTAINVALWRRGLTAYRSNDIALVHNSPCRTLPRLLRHHFVRGRAFGRLLVEGAAGGSSPTFRVRLLAGFVPTRIVRTSRNVRRWGDLELQRRYRSVYPLVVGATISAWAGTLLEVARHPMRFSFRRGVTR